MKYRPEIDGLRALAVVPVILFHAGFGLFSGGFVGVDVFFVISGYLITTILIEDLENDRFSLLAFYERRARRILPALFFVMFVCIPFAWMWMLPHQTKEFSQSLIAVSLFASNILFWLESGYFESASEEKPLLHTWSLAVEEQYYVLFPIFLLFAWRFGKNRVFWMIVFFAALSLAFSEWGWRNRASANFYLAPTRAWELLAGSIAAFVVLKRGTHASNLLSLFGLAAILFAVFSYDEGTPFPSVYALVPVMGVVLLVLYAQRGTLVASLLGSKLFVGVGLISYSAYLWHQPLFAFARIRLPQAPSDILMIFLSILSVTLAFLSWKFIEKPFRKKEPLITKQSSVFLASIAGIFLFSSTGLWGNINQGFEQRYEKILAGDVYHLEFHQYVDENYVDCEPAHIAKAALTWNGFLRCKQSSPGDADWILLGDSHAEHLFLGLADLNPSKNLAFYIFGGKPYLENEEFREIFDVLRNAEKAKTVFLTMHYVNKVNTDNELYENFTTVVGRLKESGHDIVLLGDIPRYEAHPQDCVFSSSVEQATRTCSMNLETFEDQKLVFESSLIDIAQAQDIRYFSLHGPLCQQGNCSMIDGDTILYRDNNHLNIPGSKLIGSYLSDLLQSEP